VTTLPIVETKAYQVGSPMGETAGLPKFLERRGQGDSPPTPLERSRSPCDFGTARCQTCARPGAFHYIPERLPQQCINRELQSSPVTALGGAGRPRGSPMAFGVGCLLGLSPVALRKAYVWPLWVCGHCRHGCTVVRVRLQPTPLFGRGLLLPGAASSAPSIPRLGGQMPPVGVILGHLG
jgi:hypothetical protein